LNTDNWVECSVIEDREEMILFVKYDQPVLRDGSDYDRFKKIRKQIFKSLGHRNSWEVIRVPCHFKNGVRIVKGNTVSQAWDVGEGQYKRITRTPGVLRLLLKRS